MPFYALEAKVEQALKAVVLTADRDGVPVYMGQESRDETEEGEQGMRVPYILCICDFCRQWEDGQMVGIYRADARVEVWTHKHDEPGVVQSIRLGAVRDVLITDTLATDLSDAVAAFHCVGVVSSTLEIDNSGIHFLGTVGLELAVSPSDL